MRRKTRHSPRALPCPLIRCAAQLRSPISSIYPILAKFICLAASLRGGKGAFFFFLSIQIVNYFRDLLSSILFFELYERCCAFAFSIMRSSCLAFFVFFYDSRHIKKRARPAQTATNIRQSPRESAESFLRVSLFTITKQNLHINKH